MASVNAEDLDPINNNTMSNNNNSSNVNNNNTAVLTNVVIPGSCNDASAPCNGGGADASAVATAVPMVSTVDNNSSTSNFNSRSRSSSSRRSRSGGRSRSRRRHSQSSGRRSRHHSRGNHKRRDRNFPSALCNMISIVILCTALAEPSWIRIDNGHCTQLASSGSGGPPYGLENLRYLGALQFFYFGEMITNDPNVNHKEIVITEYRSGPEASDRMINCVTEQVVILFKVIIALTFLAILTSLLSFSLDLVGLDNRLFRILRQSAIFNIFTVVVCVGITTLLYWATADVLDLQLNPTMPDMGSVRVLFDVSFYLITAAGACSVISVACNCLQRKISDIGTEASPAARSILDDQFSDGTENLLAITSSSSSFHQGHDFSSPMTNLPPPPPYTP